MYGNKRRNKNHKTRIRQNEKRIGKFQKQTEKSTSKNVIKG